MASRCLFLQFALAALVMVAANVATHRLAQNSIPRQILRAARDAVGVTDLFFGNSMVQAGVDESVMAKARPGSRPLNMGLGSSYAVEHYLLYRQQTNHTGATIYYGYSDIYLTAPVKWDWAALVGNRAMSYYIEPEVACRFYAAGSPFRALVFRMCSLVPMVVERYAIWGRVEKLRRWLGALGLPPQDSNRFGRVEDFKQLRLPLGDFVAHCERAVSENTPLSLPIAALFEDVRTSGRRLCVVELPSPSQHRQIYHQQPVWKAYQKHVKDLVRSVGGEYVEASDWVDDSGFADVFHLNQKGAAVFSERMAKRASGR